jgi:hypothetical protein
MNRRGFFSRLSAGLAVGVIAPEVIAKAESVAPPLPPPSIESTLSWNHVEYHGFEPIQGGSDIAVRVLARRTDGEWFYARGRIQRRPTWSIEELISDFNRALEDITNELAKFRLQPVEHDDDGRSRLGKRKPR